MIRDANNQMWDFESRICEGNCDFRTRTMQTHPTVCDHRTQLSFTAQHWANNNRECPQNQKCSGLHYDCTSEYVVLKL